ncbi:hypothetical protein M758_UG020500 [Ceratodon purpureus]|nr:hypothetical protein M758_UG020500 [Ceratodon purpureus]
MLNMRKMLASDFRHSALIWNKLVHGLWHFARSVWHYSRLYREGICPWLLFITKIMEVQSARSLSTTSSSLQGRLCTRRGWWR